MKSCQASRWRKAHGPWFKGKDGSERAKLGDYGEPGPGPQGEGHPGEGGTGSKRGEPLGWKVAADKGGDDDHDIMVTATAFSVA